MVTVAAPLGERRMSAGGLWRWGRPAGIAALIAVLCFLSLYPMLMLLYGSLHSTPPGIAGTFNLDGYVAIATTEPLIAVSSSPELSAFWATGASFAPVISTLTCACVLAPLTSTTSNSATPVTCCPSSR